MPMTKPNTEFSTVSRAIQLAILLTRPCLTQVVYSLSRGAAITGECDSGSLLPKSVRTRNENRACLLYKDPNCETGTGMPVWDGCLTSKDYGWDNFKSFRCVVSPPAFLGSRLLPGTHS
ncbi:hypothetical protein BDV96DRAFT_561579 [Lophiotrema nucula]|uniref:Uncharacterized protein n=1 Tax=Lophiotrema nucula TaxID=690887 RepID=A0A6A5ZTS8_9PLEO|nr:hypothetical protein BDV96DRAFT_561579 [Lophiotrema nucula]